MDYELYHYDESIDEMGVTELPKLLSGYEYMSKDPYAPLLFPAVNRGDLTRETPLILVTTNANMVKGFTDYYNIISLILVECDISLLFNFTIDVKSIYLINVYNEELSRDMTPIRIPSLTTLGYIPSNGYISLNTSGNRIQLNGLNLEVDNISQVTKLEIFNETDVEDYVDISKMAGLTSLTLTYNHIVNNRSTTVTDNIIRLVLLHNDNTDPNSIVGVNSHLHRMNNLKVLYASTPIHDDRILCSLSNITLEELYVTVDPDYDDGMVRCSDTIHTPPNLRKLSISGYTPEMINGILDRYTHITELELLEPHEQILAVLNFPRCTSISFDCAGYNIPNIANLVNLKELKLYNVNTSNYSDSNYIPLVNSPPNLSKLYVHNYTDLLFEKFLNNPSKIRDMTLLSYNGMENLSSIPLANMINVKSLILDCVRYTPLDLYRFPNLEYLRLINVSVDNIQALYFDAQPVDTIFTNVIISEQDPSNLVYLISNPDVINNKSLLYDILNKIEEMNSDGLIFQ